MLFADGFVFSEREQRRVRQEVQKGTKPSGAAKQQELPAGYLGIGLQYRGKAWKLICVR